MTNIELEKLAQKYINDVNRVCKMMLQAFNLTSKEELIKYRSSGEFYSNGGDNRYAFHGRGCRFSNNELEIDWDFGYGDNWCGLDPWKLFYYIENNKFVHDFSDGYQIKEIFDDFVVNGKMVQKYDLYYINVEM